MIKSKTGLGKPVLLSIGIFIAVFLLTGAWLTSPTLAIDAKAEEGKKVVFIFEKPKIKITENYYITHPRKLLYTYKTVAVTATSGQDYKEYSSHQDTVRFPEGNGTATVIVETYLDDIDEGDGETFKLVLYKPYYWDTFDDWWERSQGQIPEQIEQIGKILEPSN